MQPLLLYKASGSNSQQPRPWGKVSGHIKLAREHASAIDKHGGQITNSINTKYGHMHMTLHVLCQTSIAHIISMPLHAIDMGLTV